MQTKSARKGEFTTQHARLVLAQWRSNMSLARGYANDGKPEHAAYSYKMARETIGVRDKDQEYA